ncbi:putative DNA binding domain-containing protein [Hymenobacter sp. BT770]|uniref:RNA-binding domain-containing protein n=1 Tax=Hymenobacter sp. BT770 TaxID=2886942 RepID=UPI001D10E9F8|nr:RNA-binding domain-containing protein [Hymenobacter sp. BT770]MCC3152600.1 putative DNA binding domain-containing protein [Hymenobacter sp. BT770]MDO3414673.1 putative DNA binding domain-containing protein [Hymenobacter sp. BT770]
MGLPVNIKELLTGHTVEWERLEFKAGWNPEDVLHSICAFANDINNWGGGYVIVGIKEQDGRPVLPPQGLPANQLDKIQKELLQLCYLITPHYFPVAEPVEYQGQWLLIIWIPGGQTRPYKAPLSIGKDSKSQKVYWVRHFANTVQVRTEADEQRLLELAAKVPFDDRINHQANISDLSPALIRDFLREIKSNLAAEAETMPFVTLCEQMRLVSGPPEYLKPLNIALLMFNEQPERFFRGAVIEVIIYHDEIGDQFTEKRFTGPLHRQLRQVLEYLRNQVLQEEVQKVSGQAEARRFFNYPYDAVEEALANAVYHRSYESQQTIEVNVRPTQLEILSYPGALPPVTPQMLTQARIVSRDYRNRRVGDFLRELHLTEGRATGLPKIRRAMQVNGSRPPVFEMDEAHSYFLTILPVHPDFVMRPLTIREQQILRYCQQPRTRKEILSHIGLGASPANSTRYLAPLVELGYLAFTIPDAPKSVKQAYILTDKGSHALA